MSNDSLIVRDLATLELPLRKLAPYDRPIGMQLLHEDTQSGVELFVVEYPAGTQAAQHRHAAAHTMVVLAGQLEVNGEILGPGSLCRIPAETPMHHAPAAGASCRFLMIFEGESDVTVIDDDAG